MEVNKHHSLLEVLQSVQRMFEHYWKKPIWVKVEMAKINFYTHSGHAYPLLVEKREGKTVAEIRSTVWSRNYQRIKTKFEAVTKKEFIDGLEVLLLVEVKFTASHGLALNIIDLDASYTLGAMELEKKLTIEKLKEQRLFDNNKLLDIPILLKRIAVISVETSKGYHDFENTLTNNKNHYKIEYELFPALLQGDRAIASIRNQLDEIRSRKDEFDVLAIIRGGGGEVGLNCYDSFSLSSSVAQFPLPIITGIGHATNLTVVEMVAFKNLITPTALANFVLDSFESFHDRMILAESKLIFHSERVIQDNFRKLQSLIGIFDRDVELMLKSEGYKLESIVKSMGEMCGNYTSHKSIGIDKLIMKLNYAMKENIQKSTFELENFELALNKNSESLFKEEDVKLVRLKRIVSLLNPINTLKRGYSISRINGEVNNVAGAKVGDVVTTETYTEIIKSRVENIEKK